MKSAYELAMERLSAASPNDNIQLTDAQKEELADLDNKYQARTVEKKIAMEKRVKDARMKGDYREIATAEKELVIALARIESDREAAKERVRQGKQLGA